MNRWIAFFLIVTATCAKASNSRTSLPEAEVLCANQWCCFIEEKVPTDDGQGHGPDIGSDEWMSVVEFKLGIRDKSNLPDRGSEVWCRYIDQIVRAGRTSSDLSKSVIRAPMAPGPSYACDKVKAGSIEAMICRDAELSALDRKLSDVYGVAYKIATNEHPSLLKAEQRGWIKSRNECWQYDDKRGCVHNKYLRRIAELQARYRLVPGNGPVHFICEENPANEVVVTFFQTDPPTMIAEHRDSFSLMYLQPSGSGTKYQGRNESFWEHHGEALLTWGYGAQEMRCKKAP